MRQELDKLMDAAGRVADKAARATSTVVERSKDKMELYKEKNAAEAESMEND